MRVQPSGDSSEIRQPRFISTNQISEEPDNVRQLWRKTSGWGMKRPPELPSYCSFLWYKCSAGVLLRWQTLKLPHLPLNGTAAHNYSFDQLLCRASKSLLLLVKCQRFKTKALYLLGNMKNRPFYFFSTLKMLQRSIRCSKMFYFSSSMMKDRSRENLWFEKNDFSVSESPMK